MSLQTRLIALTERIRDEINDIKQDLQNVNGTSSYTYIGYANDASGAGFSLSPAGKTFIAFRTSPTPLTPVPSDFAGLWVEFVGAGSAETLPAKRVMLTWTVSGIWQQRMFDAEQLSIVKYGLSPTTSNLVATKAAGRIYAANDINIVALNSAMHITDTVIDGQTGNTAIAAGAGLVYDNVSDAIYCITNSNNITKITNTGFVLTRNSVNTVPSATCIVVGAGRVFVFTSSNTIHVFDTNLAFIGTTSVPGSLGTFNPDKNRVVSSVGSGYIEVHPTTFAQTNISSSSGCQCVAYGNGKYILGRTTNIQIYDATTNTIITTLGTAEGVPSGVYVSAIFYDGKFWVASSQCIVVIDAATNTVVKMFVLRPNGSTNPFMLSSYTA